MSNGNRNRIKWWIRFGRAKKYKVFLLNDDFSTMDFVIDVLVRVFRKSVDEASVIMINIHNNGKELWNLYLWNSFNKSCTS